MAELENLKAHGVLYPTFYQGYNEELLRQEIQLREKAGLPKGIFFSCQPDDSSLKRDKRWTEHPSAETGRRWSKFLAPLGYADVYLWEEPEMHCMYESSQQKAARYKACREAGSKVFCWFSPGQIDDAIREQIDIGNGGALDDVDKFHKLGHKILAFILMPVLEKFPQRFRHGFSLAWWQNGYDGVLPYCYQHAYGQHIWNDFDHRKLRDHNFTYPTVDGVIDTLCWEAFREGIDDVRYVTTLEQAIKKAENSRNSEIKKAVISAEKYLEKLKNTDLTKKGLRLIRLEIISHILQLTRKK